MKNILFKLFMKAKLKAEPLHNRILLLMNRSKGYLNEVGRKLLGRESGLTLRSKGYLNEVGRKRCFSKFETTTRSKGYLNEVGRKLMLRPLVGLKGI